MQPTSLASNKRRIGVLMGGKSTEREVSFNSGRTLIDHLDTALFEAVPIFQTQRGTLYLLPWHFLHRGKISDFEHRLVKEADACSWEDLKGFVDLVYIAMHGAYAEDGTMQGTLDILGIPYVGAKVRGSAMGMDKAFQRIFLTNSDIVMPRGFSVSAHHIAKVTQDELEGLMHGAGFWYPCVVKPSHEGSSVGITVVQHDHELLLAVANASRIDPVRTQAIIIEEKIIGMEFSAILLEQRSIERGQCKRSWWPLPITQIIPEKGSLIYDYEQKYMPGRATKITPAPCDSTIIERINQTTVRVCELLEFEHLARIDGFVLDDGTVVITDPNSFSGLAPSSFIFDQAAEAGMNHTQLINYLIGTAMSDADIFSYTDPTDITTQDTKRMRVAVLMGGDTHERETSLDTGRNVVYKLSPHLYEPVPIFVDEKMRLYRITPTILIKNSTRDIAAKLSPDLEIAWSELPKIADFVFIGLHGGRGENGAVQGFLEMLDLPYNGSGILTSALCMDKFKTTSFLRAQGFDVAPSTLIAANTWNHMNRQQRDELLDKVIETIGLPCIIKPHDDGCSVMVHKVANLIEVHTALNLIFDDGKPVAMVEAFIEGMELTIGVMGNDVATALPPSQSIAQGAILSMQEKFLPGAGENLTPAPLAASELSLVQETAEKVYQTLNCHGYARIDCFFQDAATSTTGSPRVLILEVNTLPALTPATCIFHQAAEVGMRPMEFINKIIRLGLENRQMHAPAVSVSHKSTTSAKNLQQTLF